MIMRIISKTIELQKCNLRKEVQALMQNNNSGTCITSFIENCKSAPSYYIDDFAKNALEAVKSFMLTAEGKNQIDQRVAENKRRYQIKEEGKICSKPISNSITVST